MRHFYLLLLLFFIMSCSKDNDTLDLPLEFEIIVTDISESSATINWSDASSPTTGEVKYNIYLNNELIQSNFNSLQYVFTGLNGRTVYNVSVEAFNPAGEINSQTTFHTDNEAPLDFEVTITNITDRSATVSWTDASSNSTGTISYKIFVNDELFIDNISDLTYELSDLDYNTTYDIMVTATNTNRESTTVESSFITEIPENVILLINSISTSNSDSGLRYYYDSFNRIEIIQNYLANLGTRFNYDNNGKIILENQLTEDGSNRWNYYYIEDELTELHYSRSTSFDLVYYDYIIDSPEYLTYEGYYQFDNEEEYYGNYSFSYTYDAFNRVTSVVRERLDIVETIDTMHIEYENGNIIRLTDFDGHIYDMVYDDKNNFRTFIAGPITYLHQLPVNLNFIPFLNRFLNRNNVLAAYKDNDLLFEFEFEYNIFNYPINYIVSSTNGSTLWNIEYDIIFD